MSAVGRVEDVEVWDWYDGLVSGLVRLSWVTGAFLASVVAWSRAGGMRALCCVPLSDSQLDQIGVLARTPWERFSDDIKAFSRRLRGKALIIVVDETSGDVVSEHSVDLESVTGDLLAGIEEAMAPARERWFHLPG